MPYQACFFFFFFDVDRFAEGFDFALVTVSVSRVSAILLASESLRDSNASGERVKIDFTTWLSRWICIFNELYKLKHQDYFVHSRSEECDHQGDHNCSDYQADPTNHGVDEQIVQ